MRLKYLKTKIVPITLVFVMLLQSCSIYKKTPVTLDEAAKANSKVLVERTNKEKFKLKKIENIDGKYLGKKKVKGETVSIQLDEKDIQSIRVLDKSKSTVATVFLVVGSAILITAVIIAATFDLNFGGLGGMN